MAEPDQTDVAWLAQVATAGDNDRAAWELRYLRRSLGWLVAQRDALDDKTLSAVARELIRAMRQDRGVAASMIALAERQFNERLSGYREMMGARGAAEGLLERVGRALLLHAGAIRISAEEIKRGSEIVDRYLTEVGDELRSNFGTPVLAATPAGRAS